MTNTELWIAWIDAARTKRIAYRAELKSIEDNAERRLSCCGPYLSMPRELQDRYRELQHLIELISDRLEDAVPQMWSGENFLIWKLTNG